MQTNQDRLNFVVDLAQKNLEGLRPGDLLNLRDDFVSFFAKKGEDMRGPIGEIVLPFTKPLPQDFTVEDFESLQKDVYPILNEIVAGRDTGMPAAPVRKLESITLTALSFRMNGRSVLTAHGSTRDMFLLRLYLLLSREPVDRLLRCKAPDCDVIFYRKRKQEFCSTKCTNRAYMKEYRKDANFAANAAEESHKRYASRVKKKSPTKAVKRRLRRNMAG